MAFPYIFSESFDQAGKGGFDTETDVSGALDYPTFYTLAGIPGAPAPYRGGACMRIAAPANTADHTLIEADINIGASNTGWTRFALYVSTDFAATADDIFNIYELQATGTVETAISLQIIAATDIVSIGIGETAAASFPATVEKGKWHVIELSATVDSGVGNDGTSTLYMNGNAIQTISSLDQGAVTDGVLGTQDTLATTDTGYLLFDEFAFDDLRCGITDRWVKSRLVTSSSFMFVGRGRLEGFTLLDGGSNDVTISFYDTNVYSASLTPVHISRTVVANTDILERDLNIDFHKGCLAVLGGTLPGAIVRTSGMTAWGSDGAVKTYGSKLPGLKPI